MSAVARSKPRVIAGNAMFTDVSSGTTAVPSPTTNACAVDRFIPRGWRERGVKTSVLVGWVDARAAGGNPSLGFDGFRRCAAQPILRLRRPHALANAGR